MAPNKDSFEVGIADQVEKILNKIDGVSDDVGEVKTEIATITANQAVVERVLLVGNGEKALTTQVRENETKIQKIKHESKLAYKSLEKKLDEHIVLHQNDHKWKKRKFNFKRYAVQLFISAVVAILAVLTYIAMKGGSSV